MFAWNHYLLEPAKKHMKNTYDWCMPIVHGYVDQSGKSHWFVVYDQDVSNISDISNFGIWENYLHYSHCPAFTVLCWREIPKARRE